MIFPYSQVHIVSDDPARAVRANSDHTITGILEGELKVDDLPTLMEKSPL